MYGALALKVSGTVMAASTTVVDDFGHNDAVANYAITTQGSGGGTGTVVGENLVLASAQNTINSVSALRSDSGWHSIELVVLGSSQASYGNFTACLGNGSIVPANGGSAWTLTVLNNCYGLRVRTQTQLDVFKEVAGVLDVFTTVTMPDITVAAATLKLTVSATGDVTAFINGTQVYTTNDTSVSPSGMVAMVAQGRASNNNGGTASIDKITLGK